MSAAEPRYVVRELEGWLSPIRGSASPPGLSCMVLDRHDLHRVVATYRTETERARSHVRRRWMVRRRAHEHARRLNR